MKKIPGPHPPGGRGGPPKSKFFFASDQVFFAFRTILNTFQKISSLKIFHQNLVFFCSMVVSTREHAASSFLLVLLTLARSMRKRLYIGATRFKPRHWLVPTSYRVYLPKKSGPTPRGVGVAPQSQKLFLPRTKFFSLFGLFWTLFKKIPH